MFGFPGWVEVLLAGGVLDHVRKSRVRIGDVGGFAMIHHVSLGTNDAARAVRFYDPVLAVIGL